MLTDVPSVQGMSLGACYLPADEREHVGGDWYDVITLPTLGTADETQIVVSVGDIVGHDMHAATVMGQTRAMLRQACWTTSCASPAAVVTDFEAAAAGVGLDLAGTAVLARLRPADGGAGQWDMSWTNAGHPPPVILRTDGTTTQLDEHDILLGCGQFPRRARRDHHVTLDPGTTEFLYADGLIEQNDRDIDRGITALHELLSTLRGRTPQDIVDVVVKTLTTEAHDDTVAVAITLDP